MVLRSKKVGFLEFSDSYAKKISGQNSDFFENLVFWKKLETSSKNFFTKRKFRPRPIFWFLFHPNRSTRKWFLRGCTTVGGRGGGLWPGDEKISENEDEDVDCYIPEEFHNMEFTFESEY